MGAVITASEPSWIAPYSGLSPEQFGKLITMLRRGGPPLACRGRPWSLPLEDRVVLVAAYWRTNLTLRQLAPLFGISKSAAGRIVSQLGPLLALRPRSRFRRDTVLIVDSTLVPTRDHSLAEQSKNYRYSTNDQVVIDADSRLVVAVGQPVPGQPQRLRGRGIVRRQGLGRQHHRDRRRRLPRHRPDHPHRREPGQTELPAWKEAHNTSHRKARARVEHTFARMKTWKVLRDCRLKGDGVHHAMLGIACLHNLALTG
nr:transposase family protein [Streptomyces sp. 135]